MGQQSVHPPRGPGHGWPQPGTFCPRAGQGLPWPVGGGMLLPALHPVRNKAADLKPQQKGLQFGEAQDLAPVAGSLDPSSAPALPAVKPAALPAVHCGPRARSWARSSKAGTGPGGAAVHGRAWPPNPAGAAFPGLLAGTRRPRRPAAPGRARAPPRGRETFPRIKTRRETAYRERPRTPAAPARPGHTGSAAPRRPPPLAPGAACF